MSLHSFALTCRQRLTMDHLILIMLLSTTPKDNSLYRGFVGIFPQHCGADSTPFHTSPGRRSPAESSPQHSAGSHSETRPNPSRARPAPFHAPLSAPASPANGRFPHRLAHRLNVFSAKPALNRFIQQIRIEVEPLNWTA